jgi:hypothetical protein
MLLRLLYNETKYAKSDISHSKSTSGKRYNAYLNVEKSGSELQV